MAENWPRGRTITGIRLMTRAELEAEGWTTDRYGDRAVAVVLDDGSLLYPSCDPEGNGPGSLFGKTADGTPVGL